MISVRMMVSRTALMSAALAPGPVFAQTSAQTAPTAQPAPGGQPETPGIPSTTTAAPQQEEGSSHIADIVVTAQRRSENLQKVPIAITALPTEKLAAANVTSTASLQNVAPAVTFSQVNGFIEPRIRGIGNSSQGAGVENSVATYVDGVYISNAAGAILDLTNVQRVEVLKGPQGTLFGRNATGGLVQIITNDPQFAVHGNASLNFDTYEKIQGSGYLTGPITDTLAADISLNVAHQGRGFGQNLVTDREVNKVDHDVGVRSKLLWKPGSSTTVRLSLDYGSSLGSLPTVSLLSGSASPNYRNAAGVPIRLVHKPWDTYNNFNSRQDIRAFGASLNVAQDLGFATLTDIAAYRSTQYDSLFDADETPATVVYETFAQRDHQYSNELQLTSKGHGKFQWVVGAYYYRLNSGFLPLILYFGQPVTRTQTISDNLVNESVAGYAQATYEILPATHLTGGFRYTNERRTIDGDVFVNTAATGVTTTTPINNPKLNKNIPTWRISLDHQFGPDILGYLSWNRGFKSGGFNASTPTTPPYQPEYLDAYEAGAKTLLFGRRLRLNAAAFLYEYRNLQVNTLVGSVGITYNGAKARVYGLDVDAELVASDHLSFTGGATLLHDRFIDFAAAIIPLSNGDGTYHTSLGSAAGNRLPFAPDVTLLAGVNYKHELGSGRAQLSVNNIWSTGFYLQPDNVFKQGAYDLLSATATWTNATDRVTLKLFATNLLNKAVLSYGPTSTVTLVSYQPPRIVGGGIAFRF